MHTVTRPIVVSEPGRPVTDDEALAASLEQVAVVLAENGDHLASPQVRSDIYRGMAARRWYERNRPNGQHDDCDNPIRCTHHYDQGLAEIDHGAVLIVLNFTLKD